MTNDVPFYFIYGETPREVDLMFVHVERVSDRSAIHNGDVRPHRHAHLHQLSLWFDSEGTYDLEGALIDLPRCAISAIPAGVVHGFNVAARSDAIVISMSEGFREDCLARGEDRLTHGLSLPSLLAIPGPLQEEFLYLFRKTEAEYRHPSWAQASAIASYVRLILILAMRLREIETPHERRLPSSALLPRFHELVERHFRDHWTVADYAEALGTTRYLLNVAVAAGHGMSAIDIIRGRLLTEAKRLLLYTILQVSEISAALGFDEPSHFGRVFRQRTGSSPAAWRSEQMRATRSGR